MTAKRSIEMVKRTALTAGIYLAALAFCSNFSAKGASAQITLVTDTGGHRLFVNADPPATAARFAAPGAHTIEGATAKRTTIYLPAESSLTGRGRPEMSIDRDGVEKLAREAAERHRVDPALIRAVIATESNWNPGAVSRRGAAGLMQLIPTTAQRLGVNDVFNPQQNVDAGVRYLKKLLERYNGNLDLALAAYNAGEGAVDRAHGVPAYRETRNYVQKVQEAYFRPGSGRLTDGWFSPRTIHKDVASSGRIIFTNE